MAVASTDIVVHLWLPCYHCTFQLPWFISIEILLLGFTQINRDISNLAMPSGNRAKCRTLRTVAGLLDVQTATCEIIYSSMFQFTAHVRYAVGLFDLPLRFRLGISTDGHLLRRFCGLHFSRRTRPEHWNIPTEKPLTTLAIPTLREQILLIVVNRSARSFCLCDTLPRYQSIYMSCIICPYTNYGIPTFVFV